MTKRTVEPFLRCDSVVLISGARYDVRWDQTIELDTLLHPDGDFTGFTDAYDRFVWIRTSAIAAVEVRP